MAHGADAIVTPVFETVGVFVAAARIHFAPDQQIILHKTTEDETPLPTGHPINVSELLAAYVELAINP